MKNLNKWIVLSVYWDDLFLRSAMFALPTQENGTGRGGMASQCPPPRKISGLIREKTQAEIQEDSN